MHKLFALASALVSRPTAHVHVASTDYRHHHIVDNEETFPVICSHPHCGHLMGMMPAASANKAARSSC